MNQHSQDDPQHQSQDRTQHSLDQGTTDTTFNSPLSGKPIPDSPGVQTTPGSGHDTGKNHSIPLSQDVDPIHQFEEPEDFIKSAPLMGGRANSSSSDADAGLDSDLDLPNDTPGALDLSDEEAFSLESADLDEGLDGPLVEEIPMGNLDVEGADEDPEDRSTLMSPSLDAPEVDIEALGDGAIEDLLPPDARLDPIEE